MFASTPTVLSVAPTAPLARRGSAMLLRPLLVAGCAIAAGAVFAFVQPGMQDDAELATLLRGMAAIKSLMVVAAIALLLWRFGHPIRRRFAVGYLVGAYLVTGATAMIWLLTAIVPAALAFHAGGLLLLVLAWRDDAAPIRLRSEFLSRRVR